MTDLRSWHTTANIHSNKQPSQKKTELTILLEKDLDIFRKKNW
jgi:hypothetical protein